jgi:AcrR family transcriptional regulator
MKQSSDTQPSGAGGSATGTGRRERRRKSDVVLKAAEQAFFDFGYGNTSMDAIAELAGVSKRTVYSNFGSKQDLFAAVIRKRCADVLPDAIERLDLATNDPEATLSNLAVEFVTSIFSRPQLQLYKTVVADSGQFPEIGKIMFEGPISESQQIFDKFFRAQAALGHLEFDDIDMAAPLLIGMLKNNLHMRLLFNQPTRLTKKVVAESAAAAVHLFLNGALPRQR